MRYATGAKLYDMCEKTFIDLARKANAIILVLSILSRLINLIIKAECWVAGVGFLLLAIIKHQWLQVGIFAGMAGVGAIFLFLSANIQILLEDSLERLKS